MSIKINNETKEFYDTASISETHRRLLAEGHHVSESALRGWVRQGILPAARIGRTCLLYYPNVINCCTRAPVCRPLQQKIGRHTSRHAFRFDHHAGTSSGRAPFLSKRRTTMATITKIHGKNGLSFKITVHCGYDEYYRKRRHYKTYRPPATWSEQYAEREAQRIAVEFENSIRQGFRLDNRKTFAEYADYVIQLKEHTGTKHSTIELYKHLCERINPAIGHFKLTEIRPQHLNRLYISLAEDCIKHSADNARAKVDLGALLKKQKISRAALSRQAKLGPSTITAACRWQPSGKPRRRRLLLLSVYHRRNFLTTFTAKKSWRSKPSCNTIGSSRLCWGKQKKRCWLPITQPAALLFPKRNAAWSTISNRNKSPPSCRHSKENL